jgi:putative transposase
MTPDDLACPYAKKPSHDFRFVAFALLSAGCQNISTAHFQPLFQAFFRILLLGNHTLMSHAFQTVLWMFLQHLAPRHNAQIRFLKAQIQILRRRIPTKRIVPNPDEKSELLRLSKEFGHDINLVMNIVKPSTYRRWINDAKKSRKPKKSGRPRLTQELRALVVRMGTENMICFNHFGTKRA